MTQRTIGFGVAGLGRGFMLMLPTFRQHPRARLVAAADPRPEARAQFEADFAGRAYDSVEALCADPAVDIVYVASPHQFHAAQAVAAARAGKHVLVEKPMALTLDDCTAMIAAARVAGTHLIVGHSHSFDAPVALARRLIASGDYGRVRMIQALNYTDFLYRPRRPEELDTAQGGGVVFSQAAHQVDIVRLLAGGRAKSVQAQIGAWDVQRSAGGRAADGAYTALLRFADGVSASLTYSGYGRFDSDELCAWIGETGFQRDAADYGGARRRLAAATDPAAEIRLKETRAYGAGGVVPGPAPRQAPHHEHFGFIVASCERADLRPLPDGVMVYGDGERKLIPLPPPAVPRAEVIDEVWRAVVEDVAPVHSGEWGRAGLEVCLAMLRSSREGREIALEWQVATR